MNTLELLGIPALTATTLTLLLIPALKKIAARIELIDKPDRRKIHDAPVPLVGGLAIALSIVLALLLRQQFLCSVFDNITWIAGALIMLVVGTLDDRFGIKPVYRLLIQLVCAYSVASSGIRITSLQGILGIHDIPLAAQYSLTVLVIVGVVNAFNLMDGIDGLLGALTVLSVVVLGVIAYQLGQYDLIILYAALTGAIFGFLRHNLSRQKVFMGDAGSLFIGFILITTSIKLLNATQGRPGTEQQEVLLLVAAVFLIPVIDSLRVYRARIKKGKSPFAADKTHIHHLFLFLGISHKKATVMITALIATITGLVAALVYLVPAVWVILTGVAIFSIITTLLTINRSVQEWKEKLARLERN